MKSLPLVAFLSFLLISAPPARATVGHASKERQSDRPSSDGEEDYLGVKVRLLVGKDGRPKTCEVIGSSGDSGLDGKACEGMMKYARFEPTKDKDGNLTEEFWTTTVKYRIR